MNVLVTGGAGYIGSHAVRKLIHNNHRVVVVDNLFRGHRAAVHPDATFVDLDLAATDKLCRVMREFEVTSVMHFAALAYVGESVTSPLDYYQNNTGGTLSLLLAMQAAGVGQLIFSSTCATYGAPERLPLVESTPQAPINPYGWSKLFVEQMLKDQAAADADFACIGLRYFNVAGCADDGSLGEDHQPETHLIPLLLQTALGQRESITVYGNDYPTADGTCVRDYVHVDDLADAHLLALEHLQPGRADFLNVGIGRGHSVREAIDAVIRVTGREIPVQYGARRLGDPPELWANGDRIRQEFGWTPRFSNLDDNVATAWDWFRRHPQGYDDSAP